jgi:hypothetical protein
VHICIGCFKSSYLLRVFEASSAFIIQVRNRNINPVNTELNPMCHLLALLGAYPIFHVSRIRVNGPNRVGVIFFFYMMKAEPDSRMFSHIWNARRGLV